MQDLSHQKSGWIGLRDRSYYYRGDTIDNQGYLAQHPHPQIYHKLSGLSKIYRKQGSAG